MAVDVFGSATITFNSGSGQQFSYIVIARR